MPEGQHPLRLAIVDDYAVVVAGVASFLKAERIDVVETGATTPVISDVDIVLYDTFGQIQGAPSPPPSTPPSLPHSRPSTG